MPFDPEILSPAEWLQAGAIGVLALTVILITLAFLWYLGRRDQAAAKKDKLWAHQVDKIGSQIADALDIERDNRRDAMSHGMDEVRELSLAIKDLATAMGSHDQNAAARQQKILLSMEELKTSVPLRAGQASRAAVKELLGKRIKE